MTEKEVRRAKRVILVSFCLVLVLLALFLFWLGRTLYWQSFSSAKWAAHPERRAGMVTDLLDKYPLVGMTEPEILALLGENDNDMGYFLQGGRFVYCLGSQRSLIDREWLLLDFQDGVVQHYAIAVD